jgi:NDP-sugar pyrophosphorylase family protein
MRNILFVPSVPATEWVRDILPDMTPAELPVAGLRMIDYNIERAQKSGFSLLEVLDWHYSEKLAAEFSDLTRTSVPIFYQKGLGELPQGLNDLTRQATPLTQTLDDGLAVVWGLCLTDIDCKDITFEPASDEECAHTPIGAYQRQNGRWMKVLPHGMPVDGVKAWHRMNLAILHEPGVFTLPGYSAEEGVSLGRNVVMEPGVAVKTPVLLQDDTWCARNVRLDGDVIIGKGSFINEGARLRRTVVGDNTYIGLGLELEDKIVIGHRVIDVESGAWIDISERGIARLIGGPFWKWTWLWACIDFIKGKSRGRRR